MADTRVKIVDLQVNVQQAIAAIAQYSQSVDEAKAKQKAWKAELKDGTLTQGQYQKAMAYSRVEVKNNQNAINTLNKQIQMQISYNTQQVGSLNQLKMELKQAKSMYDAMSESERNSAKGTQLLQHIQSLSTEIKSASSSTQLFYQRVGNTTGAASGVDSLTAKFKNFATNIAMMATGGGLIAFSKQVVQTTRNFEDGMAHVQSIVNGTKEEFDALEAKAIELGEKYRYTASEGAAAEEMLARNGLNAKETVEAVGQTMRFAQANAIDMASAADIMTNTLNASGLRQAATTQEELAHNLQRVSDVMSRTAATSATNVTDLGEAMVNAIPIAKTMGASIEDTSAQLATLADNGIKGSNAGTQMRMILNGLANSTTKQKAALASLGLTINEETIRTDGLTGTFEKLRDSGVMKLSNRMEVLGAIFGKRVAPAAIQLIQNVDRTKKHLDDLNGAMDETNEKGEKVGTTARMFGQSYSTMGVAIDALRSSWEHLQIMLGKTQITGITNTVGVLHDAVIWVADNIPTVVEVVKAAIAGITFTKLVSSARTSFTSMRNSAVSNAESASAAVTASTKKEEILKQNQQVLENRLNQQRAVGSKATAQEISLTEAQLAATKQQQAIQAANTQKLQAKEVAEWNKAQALTTGNAWRSGMAAAGFAARGFVLTCKTAFKGFIVTALISLAFEALMKLWDAFNSGEGVIGKFGTLVKGKLGSAITWIGNKFKQFISWLQNLDAKFAVTGKVVGGFTASIAIVGAVLKSVWSIVKWWAKNVGMAFKSVGVVASGVGTILKDVFTFKWRNISSDFKKLAGSVAAIGKNFADNTKNFVGEMKNNIDGAVKGVQKAIQSSTKSYIQSQNAIDKAGSGKSGKNSGKKGKGTALGQRNIPQTTQNDESGEENEPNQKLDISGGGKKSKKSSSKTSQADKEAKERQKASETEQKALDEAEKAELALLRDTAYKRREALEQQYDSEIRKLKARLENERNLTETARDAINRTIVAKEKKKSEELAKLDDEELKNTISRQQKLNEARLAVIQKGSEDELQFRLANIELKRRQDQLSLNEEEKNATENSQMNVSVAQKEASTANSKVQSLSNEGKRVGDTEYDDAVKAADAANKRLADAEAEQTATKQYYVNLRASLDEKARQDSLTAEQEYQKNLNDIRIKEMQEQLAQIQLGYSQQQQTVHDAYEKLIAENEQRYANESQQDYEERMKDLANDVAYQQQKQALKEQMDDADMQQAEKKQQEEQNLKTLGLEVSTQQELDALQQQKDIDQQKYEQVVAQGQLEGETEAEYQARVMDARTQKEKSTEAVNAAEVKNEQAKLQSFQSVGQGLISVLNAVGENSKTAAKLSKIVTLAQIAIDTGKALSAGIASASSLPFPANLAAIGTTVATILANIATAISTVKSAKFAKGGKVEGGGTGTSDSVDAKLSRGEFVVTAKATRLFEPLLVTMNQIGAGVPVQANNSFREVQNTDSMTDSFTQAAKEITNVVSVEEITDKQNRVKAIQQLDNI